MPSPLRGLQSHTHGGWNDQVSCRDRGALTISILKSRLYRSADSSGLQRDLDCKRDRHYDESYCQGEKSRLPLTARIDTRNSTRPIRPLYKCLPYGPTRGLQSTNPFQIIQNDGLFGIITEHIDYRLVYTDGRRHPEDILDYPEWMGHSIGRGEGDTLVVDTIGMREETWLDTAGFEHSAMLHLTERLRRLDPITSGSTSPWRIRCSSRSRSRD